MSWLKCSENHLAYLESMRELELILFSLAKSWKQLWIGSKTNGFPVIYEPINDEGLRAMKCRTKISILVVTRSKFLIGATRLFVMNFSTRANIREKSRISLILSEKTGFYTRPRK